MFRGWNAWIKSHLTYLDVSKLEQRYGWCFWRPNDSMKGKFDAFSVYKWRSIGVFRGAFRSQTASR